LGYHGLGDIFVFIFFGLAAVAGTYFVQVGSVSPVAWWMAIPIGLIVTAILVVNNLRDLESDRKAGKHTLAVRLGERGAKTEYALLMALAYLIVPVVVGMKMIPISAMFAWFSLPLAIRTLRVVFTQTGRPLNAALAGTGQTAFLFSIFFWLGLLFH
jgi:1,4-dihydroxy-2-naphthoate octaprenyltransferase